jgi:hypothetical protein
MNAITKPERSAGEAATVTSAVEGEVRDVVRSDLNAVRRRSDPTEINADHFNSLIERVAGTSLKEIDNLIAELQAVRDFLMAEGERVQRELTSYARATEAALSSVRMITESMGEWKNSARPSSRIVRG